MPLCLEPQRIRRLLAGEARLHEEVTQREHPELPLPGNAQQLGAVPWLMAQRLLAFGCEPGTLSRGLLGSDVKGTRCFGEVGDEEVAEEGDGEGDDAADDEEPL